MEGRYPLLFMVALILFTQLGALAAAGPLDSADIRAVDNPESPVNSAIYIGIILVFTAFLLLASKLGFGFLIRAVFALAMVSAIYYAGLGIIGTFLPLAGPAAHAGAFALGVVVTAGVFVYPEWYLVDIGGLLTAIGVTSILGVSLGTLPVVLLLGGLAVYDALAVYRTGHMLDLADSALEFKLPVMFVVPVKAGYSFLDADSLPAEEGERGAFFLGLGDAVMPGILTVSAYVFGEPLYAAGSLIGTLVGFVVLSRLVSSGRAQAGLPPLNGGAIAGYFVATLARTVL